MTRSRLWLLAASGDYLRVAIVATQHFALAQIDRGCGATRLQRPATSCTTITCGWPWNRREEEHVRYWRKRRRKRKQPLKRTRWPMIPASEATRSCQTPVPVPVDEGEVSETGTNIQERGVDEFGHHQEPTARTSTSCVPQSLLDCRDLRGRPAGRGWTDRLLRKSRLPPGTADRQREKRSWFSQLDGRSARRRLEIDDDETGQAMGATRSSIDRHQSRAAGD